MDINDRNGFIEDFEDIILSRASFLTERVIHGVGLTVEEAYEILQNADDKDLTDEQKELRKIILAAVDNLVEFATAQEYQLIKQIPEDFDIEDGEELAEMLKECKKYNLVYASAENDNANQAALLAAMWLSWGKDTMVMYNTQRDERVRESHAILDGIEYSKEAFPEDMIPPIDWGCRCYLTTHKRAASNATKRPYGSKKIINPVFKESLCKGGRIFSKKHPYFQIDKEHKKTLKKLRDNVKERMVEKWQTK